MSRSPFNTALPPEPLVSVVVPTYGHAAYIAECLTSILAQQFDAPWEILIGEDGGTDGTREICEQFVRAHPDRIRLMVRDRKDVISIMGQPTGRSNVIKLYAEARGKYIAICEGDDFWTDTTKLKQQVDHLERHPEHVLCFHRAELLQDGARRPHPIPATVDLGNVRIEDLLATHNFISTASIVFRRDAFHLPDWFRTIPFGDLTLCSLLSKKGGFHCIDAFMSVYRITGHGLFTKVSRSGQWRMFLRFYRIISPHLTDAQRALVSAKRAEILEKMAHEHYPVNPRRKWVFKMYLQLKYPA